MPKNYGRTTRSVVQQVRRVAQNRRRAMLGIRPENIVLGMRHRGRPRAFLPGDDARLEMVMFPDGNLHVALNPGGQYIRSCQITYTGTRPGDFNVANAACGYAATPPGHVWHHFHDYAPVALADGTLNPGRGTLYLMRNADHGVHHWGGAQQYRLIHGVGY